MKGEKRKGEKPYTAREKKVDNYGLHTSFNLISREPLDHELHPEGFYLFLYKLIIFLRTARRW